VTLTWLWLIFAFKTLQVNVKKNGHGRVWVDKQFGRSMGWLIVMATCGPYYRAKLLSLAAVENTHCLVPFVWASVCLANRFAFASTMDVLGTKTAKIPHISQNSTAIILARATQVFTCPAPPTVIGALKKGLHIKF
jgi:hypothetical protein